VLPILTDLYDYVLPNQKITLRFDERGFYIQAEANRVPVNPRTYARILIPALETLKKANGTDSAIIDKVNQVLTLATDLASQLSPALGVEKPAVTTSAQLKDHLWQLALQSEEVRSAIDATLRRFNGTQGDLEGA